MRRYACPIPRTQEFADTRERDRLARIHGFMGSDRVDETFAKRLRGARERRGMSKYRLAQIVGCTEAAIRAWETGRNAGPSLPVGLKIAKALRADPEYLAFGEATAVRA